MGCLWMQRVVCAPKRRFVPKIGVGRGHSSGNGTFHGVKGFFVPKKGVSCQKRCRRGAFVWKWDILWGKGGFHAQKGCFVPEKVQAGRIRPEIGRFVRARGFLCPEEVFHARKGAGGEHTSRNGTFRGRKGLFVPKKGVSCKNRCGQEYCPHMGRFVGARGCLVGPWVVS